MKIDSLSTAMVAGGAIVTAFGLAILVGVSGSWGVLEGDPDRQVFVPATLLAIALWAVSRLWWRKRAPNEWRTWQDFVDGTLLIAWVIFALGWVGAPHRKAAASYPTAMMSDLRNLDAFEEEFRADSGRYTRDFGKKFRTSAAIIGPDVALTADGWTASVKHQRTTRTCAMFVGSTPLPPATVEGKPACTPPEPEALDLSGLGWASAFLAIGLALGVAGSLRSRTPSERPLSP